MTVFGVLRPIKVEETKSSKARSDLRVRRFLIQPEGEFPAVVEPLVNVTVPHAKTGALTLANDFLAGALGKASLLPSAER